MSLPLHEAGHSLAAQVFGASGYIEIDWFGASGYFYTKGDLETWQAVIVSGSGGLFVAILYSLMLWFANVGIKWDENDKTPIRVVLGGQLGYGLAEISILFVSFQTYQVIAVIGTVTGLIIAFIYSFPKLNHWWNQSTILINKMEGND